MKKYLFKKGQAVVEAILLMVILFGLVTMVFKNNPTGETVKVWMNEIFNTPRDYLRGMVRSGVWKKHGDPQDSDFRYHPNTEYRHVMSSGESVK